jgi:C4-dicarboxylate-specific signal transduction histidine kinase
LTVLRSFPHPHRLTWIIGCIALVPLIALGDYATGYELSLAILYLVPIFAATWVLGRGYGIAISVFALVSWLISVHFMGFAYAHPFYHLWEALIRLVTWVIFVLLLARLRVALAHADERFVTVLEGLDAAVYVTDATNDELLYVNQTCRAMFAAGNLLNRASQIESRFTPRPAHEFAHGQQPADDDAATGEFVDSEGNRTYLIHARSIRWIDGRAVRLNVATDITLQKQTQELNRQQQEKLQLTARLISVGEMASTLAHELNQPLAAIANYNMGCVRRLRSGDYVAQDLLEAMEKSGAEAERAGRIIQRAREMVRRREPQRADCNVNDVVTDIVNMVEIDAEKNGVVLSLHLAAVLPRVLGDKLMLEQAVLNLTRNAIDAMRDTPHGQRKLAIASHCDDGRMVEIEVRDSGCGIPDTLAENLFTPFFTTKREGLGMGLSICRSIAEFHDGRLWARRNPDAGSTFYFSLPAAA